MVDDPFWITVKESGTWVDINLLVVSDRSVAFLGVLAAGVVKEACSHGFANGLEVFLS